MLANKHKARPRRSAARDLAHKKVPPLQPGGLGWRRGGEACFGIWPRAGPRRRFRRGVSVIGFAAVDHLLYH